MRKSFSQHPPLELLTEVAPDGACFGHIPSLPGLCFRAGDLLELHQIAVVKVAEYARWLLDENLVDISPEAAAVVQSVRTGHETDIQIVETERRKGAPLWISGNPAVLFDFDRRALNDVAVRAHVHFTRQVVRQMRVMVTPLTFVQRAWKSAANRRSLDETLAHVGNCVWWYCSRIDDALPDPDEPLAEEPIDRVERLLDAAFEFLLSIPFADRSEVHVPVRFPTADPNEPWTHTKVCRRQAEHTWEHLSGLTRAVSVVKGT